MGDVRFEMTNITADDQLLRRAQTQWQFGDWQNLAKLSLDRLERHPRRGELALYAAAGKFQLGQAEEARQCIRLAHDSGASKIQICQILVSGVHNSLGRAAAICDQQEQVLHHFASAIAVGGAGADQYLLTPARIREQLSQLRLPKSAFSIVNAARNFSKSPSFHVIKLAEHDLGDAWAGNTINTVIFRHHGILTHNKIQYTAFYVNPKILRLVRRDLATETIQTYDLLGEYNLKDAHNSISLGVDRQGHLHISYDHHATQLRYRRSLIPGTINAWSDELPMTGHHEQRVTYPTFILPHHGFPLTLLYRDGVHDKGTARMKAYDEISQTWIDHPQAILSGAEQKPWTSNAYWNHPAVGVDGSLHLSFVWRTHSLGKEQNINNINIGYACSFDNGLTWQTSLGRPCRLPITQVNAEIVYPLSPGMNLINQTGMALDTKNRPHIVFYANDFKNIPQYQYLWFDGELWNHQIISHRSKFFELRGKGTLQIPISRPEVVIDEHDNAYIITRSDYMRNKFVITMLAPPYYEYYSSNDVIMTSHEVGFAEPVIDRERWKNEKILTTLVQYNKQPQHDIGGSELQKSIKLTDVSFGDRVGE